LRQTGSQVTGTYQDAFTNATGTVTGTIAGNAFSGLWASGGRSGAITWTLGADGKTFDGFFIDGAIRRWCGARPDQAFPEGCSYQGDWINQVTDRNDCPMRLTRVNLSVRGVYCRGAVEGTITYRGEDQTTVLRGAWDVPGSPPGTFTFYLRGFDALQFQGHWRGDTPNEWCGWRAGSSPPSPCLLP
jgi:hypothetical protein